MKRFRFGFGPLAFAMFFVCLCTACGQKGPLKAPENDTAKPAAATTK